MNREELRAVQTPIKDRYREDPNAAVITLRADGSLADGISCSVDTGRALAVAGLHPASGGGGKLLCSRDMLLPALAACAGGTPRAVATAVGGEGRRRPGHGRGGPHFRGTLRGHKEAPGG